MNLESYITDVLRTESEAPLQVRTALHDPRAVRLLHAAMGACTESGELMDALKKHFFYGAPLDIPNIIEEIGDLMWYVGVAMDAAADMEKSRTGDALTPSDILSRNIIKLRRRYPDRFNAAGALSRDFAAERAAVDGSEVPGIACAGSNEAI